MQYSEQAWEGNSNSAAYCIWLYTNLKAMQGLNSCDSYSDLGRGHSDWPDSVRSCEGALKLTWAKPSHIYHLWEEGLKKPIMGCVYIPLCSVYIHWSASDDHRGRGEPMVVQESQYGCTLSKGNFVWLAKRQPNRDILLSWTWNGKARIWSLTRNQM